MGNGFATKAAQAEGSLKMAKCAQRMAQIERENKTERASKLCGKFQFNWI